MKKGNTISLYNPDFVREIKQIVTQARQKAYAAINSAMVDAYWQMGKRIVEQEQQGKDRADYGSQLLKSLSKELTAEFGRGFSANSLYYFRQFYLAFPEKLPTLWGILTWSHYKRLLSVSNAEARAWYLKEAAEQMWSYRTLDRNIGSQYYERLLLSDGSPAHQRVVQNLVRTISDKYFSLSRRIDLLVMKSLRAKVAAYLLSEAARAHSLTFSIPFSRIQLADYLNCDRSALSRELSTMQKEGLIDTYRSSFKLLEPDALQQMVQ